MSTRVLVRMGAVSLVVLAVGLVWQVSAAQNGAEEKREEPKASALTNTLGGVDRYLTYVSTDKPIYKPGETLFVRGVLLHHATRQPLPEAQQVQAVIEIKGPKGDTVASGNSQANESVLGFQWSIPQSQAGGEYTIHVSYPAFGHPPAERKFDVRAYRAPRLKTQIKFLRDGYGAGDEVVATLHAERAEGGVPAGAPVTVIARVDGEEAFRGAAQIDEKGNCQTRFQLPTALRRGEGTLALVIEDGGVVETASKTIPILLQTVDLTMYPEGGDLVAGLANRVYLEAFTPAKKPADLSGVVLDETGEEVASFKTEHEGRGRFVFTPAAGKKYVLKITEPSGINTQYPLPETKESGVVLSAQADIAPKGQEVRFSLAATAAGKYTLTLRQRDIELDTVAAELVAGAAKEFSLKAGASGGVLVATVWDAEGKPLAERLAFREPAGGVQIKISADSKQYVPGGKAKLTIETRDENGKPISAIVGVAATDDSVLEMVDKRDQAPRLPVMVLLEGDVKELADAHVYLDPTNEKSPMAIDLLLGTQGWRRFALVDTAKFAAEHGDAARRVLALKIATRQEVKDLLLFERGARFPAAPGAPAPARAAAEFAPPPVANEVKAAPVPAPEPQNAPPALPPPGLEKKNDEQQPRQNAVRDAEEPFGRIAAGGRAAPVPADEELKERRELQDALEKNAEKREADGILRNADRRKQIAARNDFVAVRVYAHEVRSGRKPGERTDFTETLYWHAGLKTNEKGLATVEFGLNDSVTSFRVFADGFSSAGGLGGGSLQIDSVEPFYLEPKLPLEVTAGDYIRAPIAVVNATGAALENGRIKINAHASQGVDSGATTFDLPAGARIRQMMNVNVGKRSGEVAFTLDAAAGPYADKVTRKMMVRPFGFPMQVAHGGLLAPGATASHEIIIPETLVPGSLEGRVVVYPTPLASMNEALSALIREPYGCFEQTSSTIYPLVMAQQYFMSHQGVDPALIEKSSQILQTGYERLIGFECKSGGFEWFGNDPGHDALTAYGLLEFTDMAQVRHVDPAMLERTRKWLLDQRDGKGGYLRKTHTLHTWIPDPECANSYNTWALLEAGVKEDLTTEVTWVRQAAEKAQNTYAVALAANVLALAGDKEGENHLLDKLAGKQQENGSLSGAITSVIGSGGEALEIETTALAVLAWLKNPSYASNVEKSIKYLAESCKAGRYGSTQSTVLALRAIVAYDKSRAKPTSPGSLQLVVDGQEIGQPISFDKETTGAIELPSFAALLSPGKHQVQVRMNDGSQMPYSVAVNFHNVKPDSSEKCQLHLEARLRNRQLSEGAATEAEVVVVNRANEAVPTPLAIIGIPGGLEVRHDQLKELVKAGKISAYEVLGREVVLYWRSLKAEERVDLALSLVAAVPGKYTGPASRAYLYYTDEHKHWVDGLAVEIEPKAP